MGECCFSSGIPVATVALNGAKNAAWLAAEILALSDDTLAGKLEAERVSMAQQIAAKEEKLQNELKDSYPDRKVVVPGKTLNEISKILSGEIS